MRAYRIDRPGTPDGLVLHHGDPASPGPTEVLVKVHAAALNRRDALILSGRYPLPARPGVVALSDGAGEVVATGEAVTRFRPGDRVTGSYFPRWTDGPLRPELADQLGCTVDGLLAEYAVLDEQALAAVPDHLDWAGAASFTCAGVAAWRALTGGARLLPGQTVLVLGSGDVSLFAVQFARTLGCRVIAVSGSTTGAERLAALGADHIVDRRRTPEWSGEVRRLTGGAGADLVVETHGPATIEQSVRSAAFHGQIVLLWVVGDRPAALRITDEAYAGSLATIRREFVGSRADLEAALRAAAAHGLRPAIGREFGFDEAPQAFRAFADRESVGKVVIRAAG
ncbi:NAD(P)-dependent alcohol dehydrogenase [Kitasatospora sp. A2-31]|uniref:zinc-dependent alcohol dehydrogenase family protein n=1 Tax=Kitasatospora sp. A2-31 TaxID=2916414 RepID=UPI001EE8522F|nr:NAD(P)-dependent alcohol dehydrogenase [Kitasatospora sp. A2-31]MCG6493770.1 NAD(P)-dependent alcohol dehydrogenase [Kitasatospora sp. A2-31]